MMYINNQEYEWDPNKAETNWMKHKVSFKEAATVFDDPEALRADDLIHSIHERRQWLLGESSEGRILVVIFTTRSAIRTRIISARPADKKERRDYEKERTIPF